MDHTRPNRRSFFILLSVLVFVISSTLAISLLARGYQFNYKNGLILSPTGILSAISRPKSASVYINGRLITATDDTLNLPPADYQIKITKDGYLPWEKTIKIKKELVYQTNAELYRSVPDLKPITFSGALNPTVNPDGNKIVYAVASASAEHDNGLYLLELTDNPIPILRNSPRQLASNSPSINWSQAQFTFSPNSQQILAFFPTTKTNYLLTLNQTVDPTRLVDATPLLPLIKSDWNQQLATRFNSDIAKVPTSIRSLIASSSARTLLFSSSDEKILYLADSNGTIPNQLIPAPPTQSTQTQNRTIDKNNYYVYDLKDDTNFLIGPNSTVKNISWLPNSDNLIFIDSNNIKVIEYDGTNKQTLFAGDFDKNVLTPWADSSRLIILTSPYTGAPANLYTISIK